jgi:hypothetical protein
MYDGAVRLNSFIVFSIGLACGIVGCFFYLSQSIQPSTYGTADNHQSIRIIGPPIESEASQREPTPEESAEETAATYLLDPESAFTELSQIEDISERREALKLLFDAWVLADSEAAMVALDRVGNLILRRQLHRSASMALAEANPEKAVALFDTVKWITDGQVREALNLAFSNWVEADPRAASMRALGMSKRGLRMNAIKVVSVELVNESPEKALDWAKAIERDDDRFTGLHQILERAAEDSPRWVLDHLDSASSDQVRAKLVGQAAASWAKSDREGALAWAETVDDGRLPFMRSPESCFRSIQMLRKR